MVVKNVLVKLQRARLFVALRNLFLDMFKKSLLSKFRQSPAPFRLVATGVDWFKDVIYRLGAAQLYVLLAAILPDARQSFCYPPAGVLTVSKIGSPVLQIPTSVSLENSSLLGH